MNESLKKAILRAYELCDVLDGSQNVDTTDPTTEKTVRASFQNELLSFITYLSASDGSIKGPESEFIKEYLGISMRPEEVRTFISNYQTYSKKFETTVPEVLKQMVAYDNRKFEEENKLEVSYSAVYMKVFSAAGKEFLVCDGQATENEVADYTTYTTMLMEYRKQEYKANEDAGSIFINEKNVIPGEEVEETLEELLEQLKALTGLATVKREVTTLMHLQEIKRIRNERGLPEIPVSNHLVFYGNPGTGKTTVARLLAKIYKQLGVLSTGNFVETDRSGLVGGYVGQTALKVQDVIKNAMGGVLFIDEAYSLTRSDSDIDYGHEAIDTLIKVMEDHRDDLVVIVAGYPDLMDKFINSNPGLKSRFNKFIYFEDYTPDELTQIFEGMCKQYGFTVGEGVIEAVRENMTLQYKNRGENFANARMVRNLFETAMCMQADRLYGKEDLSNEELCRLEVIDMLGIG